MAHTVVNKTIVLKIVSEIDFVLIISAAKNFAIDCLLSFMDISSLFWISDCSPLSFQAMHHPTPYHLATLPEIVLLILLHQ